MLRPGASALGIGRLAQSVGAVVLALALSMGLIAVTGRSPADAGAALYEGAFGGGRQVAGTLTKMIPLTLAALGWIVAFSCLRINVGLEGQILVGGVVAAAIGLQLDGLPGSLAIAVLGGVIGGATYAGIAALLWAIRGVNEIISTLMLNLVAVQLVSWLVRGPLQEPGQPLPHTSQISDISRWPKLLSATPLHWDILLVPASILFMALLLSRTSFGFRLRLTGASEDAARYAGVSTVRAGAHALLLSGALAGLAGSSLILAGESARMTDNFSAGYGFQGIVVALLAQNSPFASLPAALLFAFLRQGGGLMEARVGVPSSLVLITQAIVIIAVAGTSFLYSRVERRLAQTRPKETRPG